MIEAYDPTLFSVQLAESVESRVGSMVLGHTRLGSTTSQWVPVPLATFNYSCEYPPNDLGTLIVGSEAASISLSFHGEPEAIPLYPSDRVRVLYDSILVFVGTVDKTTIARNPSPFGLTVAFNASVLGSYATMMTKVLCYGPLPAETAISRIRRFVTVLGW